jgi:peptidoglycan lytic transglycosylase G
MRRRGRRGADGAQDGQSWPEPPWEQGGEPWEVPDWEEEGSFAPGADEGLPEGHPSGPMPAVSSGPLPRLPGELPPGYRGGQVPPQPGELPPGYRGGQVPPQPGELPPGYRGGQVPPQPGELPPGYHGRHRGSHALPDPSQLSPGPPVPPQSGPRPPGPLYPGPEAGAGDRYPGSVPGPRPAGYQDAGEYPRGDAGASYHDTGPTGPIYPGDSHPGAPYPPESYPASDSWERGYPGDRYTQTGDYDSGPGYPGETDSQGPADYAGEEYGASDGYAVGPDYPDDPGYGAAEGFAADQDAYDTGYHPSVSADTYGDEIAGGGYRQPRGWYGDVDDERGWPEDHYSEEGFLPGLGSGTDTRQREGGPGPGRALAPGEPARGDAKRGGTVRAGGKPAKRKRGFRRVAPWIALAVILAVLGVAGGGYYYVWHTYLHPPDYSGDGTGSVTVQIKPGDAAATVGERLQALGVVASARAFENAAKASGQGSALEPGFYRLHKHMKASLAFALLLKPSSREQVKVTIPEGLRASRTISVLGRATGELKAYQQALKDVAALGLPPAAHGNPEGYLFPATYQIQPGTKPLSVLRGMVARFGQEAGDVNLKAAAARGQLTESEVIIVASLIQAEGRHLSDFPKIAEVIYNRLNDHMRLQLDSTVLFAVNKYGILASNGDLQVNSPYNTYQRYGLPPGPIDSPGDAAIRAALHPDHGNLLYFVTVNPKTGLTKFTDSLTQFNQWKAELEQALSKG